MGAGLLLGAQGLLLEAVAWMAPNTPQGLFWFGVALLLIGVALEV